MKGHRAALFVFSGLRPAGFHHSLNLMHKCDVIVVSRSPPLCLSDADAGLMTLARRMNSKGYCTTDPIGRSSFA